MNRKQLVGELAERTGFNQADTRRMIDAFFNLFEEKMLAKESIEIKGICTFRPVVQPRRLVRNPRNNDPVMMEPRHNVRFKLGKLTLRKLNPSLDL